MGDVVNLNKYRKTKQRASETREAEINREKFGRNKAQTAQDRLQRRQDDKSLDGKKLEDSTDKTEHRITWRPDTRHSPWA
ncbi:MAG: DUF4169 family protein [Dongiales bacterium]